MPTPIVSVDREAIKANLSELVRKTVEDTLNALLSEATGDLVGAARPTASGARGAIWTCLCWRSGDHADGELGPVGNLHKILDSTSSLREM